jgi:microcystin-dependent protein
MPNIPAGFVTCYAGDLSIPANRQKLFALGWVVCDGASYEKAALPELFAAIGTANGGVGASFNVPDLKDRLPRGVNGSASFGAGTVDPDAATRANAAAGGNIGNNVGSAQADATAAPITPWTVLPAGDHTHWVAHLTDDTHEVWGGSTDTMARNPWGTPAVDAGGAHSHPVSGGDTETTPINIALYWIIRAVN